MSHLHIPDGILPVWLWVLGYLIVGLYLLFALNYLKKNNLNKKIILVGMCSAFMIIAMSIEIAPIAYHVNLSALTGIILGPILAPIAVLVTNLFLSLMGHGGITVIGLNTLVVSVEAVIAFYLFRFIKDKLNKPVVISAFIATFLALVVSASLSIGIIYAGTGNFALHGETVQEKSSSIIKFEGYEKPEKQETCDIVTNPHFNIKKFILLIFAFGLIGWSVESFLTSFIVSYINKVKPDVLNL
jgi:cobalt/nickel transport system permease protein